MEWSLPVKERWFCPWCYAWTELGYRPKEVARPQYEPVNRRWERAESPDLPEDVAHGYGYFGSTLCGIERGSLSASPYRWVPEWPDACPGCKKAAVVIDERWPAEMRGGKRINPVPPPGSDWPPF
ncbi:hypothetical protein [Streptomyces sp. NPDC127114]|uniref:hypothetical protein n=1 Tax=Streptomyces sp. NPDC127114 TaxID=3345366 RepID=UPI00364469C4